MKKITLPCAPTAESMIIGLHGYAGYGTYIKMLQLIWLQPDKCLPQEKVIHIAQSNGMEIFIVEQLLQNPALFILDNERYFPVEAKSSPRKEKVIQTPLPEHPLQLYIKKFFPIVSSMDTQMSVKNCESLVADYNKHLILEKLKAMENYKGLAKKYVNVYLTLNKWCSMALTNGWTEPKPGGMQVAVSVNHRGDLQRMAIRNQPEG